MEINFWGWRNCSVSKCAFCTRTFVWMTRTHIFFMLIFLEKDCSLLFEAKIFYLYLEILCVCMCVMMMMMMMNACAKQAKYFTNKHVQLHSWWVQEPGWKRKWNWMAQPQRHMMKELLTVTAEGSNEIDSHHKIVSSLGLESWSQGL